MNNILKHTFLLAVVLSVFSCGNKEVKGPGQLPLPGKLEEFDQLATAIARDLSLSKYSYAIVSNNEILKLREEGMSANDEISIDPLSGMFLSTLVLQCSEDQKIDVDNYLTEYGVEGSQEKVRNVLSFSGDVLSSRHVAAWNERLMTACRVLETATNDEISDLFQSKIARKANMENSSLRKTGDDLQCHSSLSDLILYSMALDNLRLFEQEDSKNLMYRPFYLETGERTPFGLGCFVEISDDRKWVWTGGHSEGFSTFLVKSTTDSLSLIITAEAPENKDPFHLEDGKLEYSPIYHAFVNVLPGSDSTQQKVDFYSGYSEMRNLIRKAMESGHRDDVYDELTAYLRMYAATGNSSRYDSLSELYRQFFRYDIPLDRLLSRPVAKVDATMDYMLYKRRFLLEQDTDLHLFATAEFTKQMTEQPWQYDNVEMYFDLEHKKTTGFNGGGDDRQYRFNYDFPTPTGNAPTFANIVLAQYDPSENQFSFEITIPWKTLLNSDTIAPAAQTKYGFDIAVADNDDQVREGSLAWHSKLNETPWNNTSFYGTLILEEMPGAADDTICYAGKTSTPVVIDGRNNGEWNSAPRYAIDNEFMSGITGPEDQSAWFRVQWDDQNLYFFIEVKDDVKRLLGKSGDYGWITDATKDTVWMMTEEATLPAGGVESNRYVSTHVPLKAGEYTLYYQTNQTHSAALWTRPRPELSFYGIVLYKAGPGAELAAKID